MNREVKFRVWTGEEMITPPKITIGAGSAAELIQIDLDGDLSLRNAYGLDGFGKNPTFDEPIKYELMQYTGLKDAAEKNVYENDIDEMGREIKWNCLHNCWGWFKNGHYESDILSDVEDNYGRTTEPHIGTKIIGNSFENPELLK